MTASLFATRSLGNTTLRLSELGFGGAPLGNLYQPITDAVATETVSVALRVGMNLFDTSPYYGFGLSERRIGDALRGIDKKQYVLSTKVGRLLIPAAESDTTRLRDNFLPAMRFESHYDYSYDGIMLSYESSLQRMGLADVDILLVHDIGKLTHGDNDAYYFNQLATSGYQALEELRRNGDVGAIGLDVNECDVCERVMEFAQFDCFLLAGCYSLLEQGPLHTLFPKCQALGISIISGGPYHSGILATGVDDKETAHYNYTPAPKPIADRVARIQEVCDAFAVTLAAAALQFPLAHPVVASVIPGLDSQQRVAETIALFNQPIPPAFWQALKDEQLLDAEAPVPNRMG